MSAIIAARGVSYELAHGRELFRDLSFSLDTGITVLVGPNGVGKTTLARLLAGALAPSRGAIERRGPVTFLPQREDPPDVAVASYLGADYGWTAQGERLLAGVPREAPCAQLSGGQWMRVRLARALDAGFLILDEPTNDLDAEGRAAVHRFLRAHTGGVLLITHDRASVRLCTGVLELSNRGLARFGGVWEGYLEARQRERESLQATLTRARRARDDAGAARAEGRARQEKRNRRGAVQAARGGIPKIAAGLRKRRAEVTTGKGSAAAAARLDDAVCEAHEAFAALKVDPVMYADLVDVTLPAQKLVAEALGLNLWRGAWLYPRDLAFAWRGGVRVAVAGPNGCGKSTLLRALMGEPLTQRGELRRGDLATLYVDQRCGTLDPALSVLENARRQSDVGDRELRDGLARFLFADARVFQRVADLSGGERLRAALACGFLATRRPELILLDEPTNNLDLENTIFLEGLIRAYRGALLVVSHDAAFLEGCGVDTTLALAAG